MLLRIKQRASEWWHTLPINQYIWHFKCCHKNLPLILGCIDMVMLSLGQDPTKTVFHTSLTSLILSHTTTMTTTTTWVCFCRSHVGTRQMAPCHIRIWFAANLNCAAYNWVVNGGNVTECCMCQEYDLPRCGRIYVSTQMGTANTFQRPKQSKYILCLRVKLNQLTEAATVYVWFNSQTTNQ